MKSEKESALTARETEILQWMYYGKSNTEIGVILGINALTVKDHVQKILRKLNALNRTQAVGKAFALRILSPGHEVAPPPALVRYTHPHYPDDSYGCHAGASFL